MFVLLASLLLFLLLSFICYLCSRKLVTVEAFDNNRYYDTPSFWASISSCGNQQLTTNNSDRPKYLDEPRTALVTSLFKPRYFRNALTNLIDTEQSRRGFKTSKDLDTMVYNEPLLELAKNNQNNYEYLRSYKIGCDKVIPSANRVPLSNWFIDDMRDECYSNMRQSGHTYFALDADSCYTGLRNDINWATTKPFQLNNNNNNNTNNTCHLHHDTDTNYIITSIH